MAEKINNMASKVKGAAGHGDSTAPAGLDSPGTFIPLSETPSSVNSKTSDLGKKGEQK